MGATPRRYVVTALLTSALTRRVMGVLRAGVSDRRFSSVSNIPNAPTVVMIIACASAQGAEERYLAILSEMVIRVDEDAVSSREWVQPPRPWLD